jgi:hypothetical protein
VGEEKSEMDRISRRYIKSQMRSIIELVLTSGIRAFPGYPSFLLPSGLPSCWKEMLTFPMLMLLHEHVFNSPTLKLLHCWRARQVYSSQCSPVCYVLGANLGSLQGTSNNKTPS